ncbi:MAG: ribosomal protein S18-alanine N-acetyltransferase [Pyrinomonadaceae bacterium]
MTAKPSETIVFESAGAGHIRDVKKLEKESRLAPWTLEDYRAEIDREDSLFIVALEKEKTVGFIIARLIMPQQKEAFELEIYNLAVKEGHRKRGIGTSLLKNLLDSAPKSRSGLKVFLEVRRSNQKAINFYKKNGFSLLCKRKNFYRNPPEDALIFERKVESE